MTKDEFLNLINDIDDKFLNELDGKPGEKRVKLPPEEYGAPQRPKVVRLERSPKKRKPRAPFIAAFTAAAVLVGVVFLVKNFGDIPTGESSGVVLFPTDSPSFSIDLSDYPGISEPTSSEPTLTTSEPTSFEPTSREPVSSEPISSEPWVFDPAISEERMKRLENEGYGFSFEVDKKERLNTEPLLKIDSVKGITIALECSPKCEGRRFTIEFYSFIPRNKTVDKCIATLTFTARSYTQSFNVLYDENELKEGDECIMFIRPEDRDYTSPAAVKGKILP